MQNNEESAKVLILAACDKDAEMTSGLLADYRISAKICKMPDDLINELGDQAGAVILAKEALCPASMNQLVDALKKQPKWSSLPVIMLLSSGELSSSIALDFIAPLPNLTLLERPIRQRVLISIVQASLADRKRQFELRDSLNEALEANRAKSEFLANMSHEIRTPLGAILGFSELIAEPGITESDRKLYLDTIKRNGQLLTTIINDILDLAKVEAGRLQIELIEVSIDDLINEVVLALEPRANAKAIRLLVERDPKLPRFITTDPIRLKQVLLNIVGNAIKFTEKGSVTITAETGTESQGTEPKKLLTFKVTDTGIGIKPEQASLLFQSFSQADSSITRRFGGTGLGLVLSQRLARALGGDLRLVESKYNKGSTFEISVALKEVRKSTQLFVETSASTEPTAFLKGLRALVVDDSKDNQTFMTVVLKRAGITTFTADNGEEGVRKAQELDPDVIFMDIQMPILSGIDATQRLRKEGFIKPIIALTAHALKGDREQCLQAGCTDYLTKPIQRTELFEVLTRVTKPTPPRFEFSNDSHVIH